MNSPNNSDWDWQTWWSSPSVAGVADAGWTPRFPAQTLPPHDPDDPSTWVSAVACDGRDRHSLSISLAQAAPYGVMGALMVGLYAYLRVGVRGLSAGIGLALAPLLALLFARWVDGPTLRYRTWGRLHRLELTSVSAVDVGKRAAGTTAVALSAPGLAKPLRLALRSRGYVMSPAARDHLRGWLSAPRVRWSAEAAALFDQHPTASTISTRRRHRLLAALLTVVLPLSLGITGAWLAYRVNAARAIAGAPGYRTFGGPHGKLLLVGRPWGQPCQPIRFAVESHVPDWIYPQVATVVAEAHRGGINVTLETRDFVWSPTSLYFPPGQSPATVVRVGIFASDGTPPRLTDGNPEHIELGWDARLDAGRRNEDLTDAQGVLWMQTLSGDPPAVRSSIRQLIAMTQGIISTTRHDSGIASGTTVDRFSPEDIAAMKLMSGCGNAVAP